MSARVASCPGGAVDGDGPEQGEAPAEERHAEQGLLEQPGLRGEEGLKGEGLPHRLVAAEHHGRLPREVSRALDDEAEPCRSTPSHHRLKRLQRVMKR